MLSHNFLPLLLKQLKYCFVADELDLFHFTHAMPMMVVMCIVKPKNAPVIAPVVCMVNIGQVVPRHHELVFFGKPPYLVT